MKKIPTFSKEGYKEILGNALTHKYNFIGFSEKNDVKLDKRYCLMRHDIDTSLKCALEMAQIEHELGIKANYFFMLRSPAYNLFSRYAFDVLLKIHEMGHEIGLHFDAAHPAINPGNLIDVVESELYTLSTLCNHPIYAVSFHQPSAEILSGDILVPDKINTYNKKQMADWYYTSDSNRIWKEYNAFSVFDSGNYRLIQMLIHPIWWIYSDVRIEDAWNSAILDNFRIMQQQFLDTEGAYGAPREFAIIPSYN